MHIKRTPHATSGRSRIESDLNKAQICGKLCGYVDKGHISQLFIVHLDTIIALFRAVFGVLKDFYPYTAKYVS